MHVDEYRDMVARQMSEDALQQQVERIARGFGWLVYHVRDSRRSQAGFPDLVLVRGSRIVFAELKTERGRTSPAQQEWLAALQMARLGNPGVQVFLWRPRDVVANTIHEELR